MVMREEDHWCKVKKWRSKCRILLYSTHNISFSGHFYDHEQCISSCQKDDFYPSVFKAPDTVNVELMQKAWEIPRQFKGVLHLWALFLKTLCIFSKNKATSDKVSYGSGQKCSKELENYSFTSVETFVVKLQWIMCENQYFPCFEP